uniref:CWH43-like N-terminal domain-containing protein n=1 Tax=Romanomermis culicivorax TaxID=13658 RepID=A0A915IS42_ROMCU
MAANFVSMSVVGSHYPQKFVWNFAVFTYAIARAYWGLNYFFVFKHCSAYSSSALWYRVFNKLIFAQTAAEILGLFVVISVTIEEHFRKIFMQRCTHWDMVFSCWPPVPIWFQ